MACCEEKFVCTICNAFTHSSFRAVFRHMGTHRADPNLHIACGIDSCAATYKNLDSYKKHIYRRHREVLTFERVQDQSENVEDEDIFDPFTPPEAERESITRPRGDEAKREAALFLLKTKEERKVTQRALDGIVRDLQGIWENSMDGLRVSRSIICNQSMTLQLLVGNLQITYLLRNLRNPPPPPPQIPVPVLTVYILIQGIKPCRCTCH